MPECIQLYAIFIHSCIVVLLRSLCKNFYILYLDSSSFNTQNRVQGEEEEEKKEQEVLGRTNCLLSFDTTRTAQKMTHPTLLRCRGNVFTEPLPSNLRDTQTDPQTLLWYDMDRVEHDTSSNSFWRRTTSFPALGMEGTFENWMSRTNATLFRRYCSQTKRDREIIYIALDRGRNYATKTIWTITIGLIWARWQRREN
jgi:hypothetical protein